MLFASHVFSDIYGKLEGESIVEASIDAILPNIWYREEPPLPIVNASSVNSIVGEALPVWKQLIRRSVDFQDINIHISTKPHELEDGWVRRDDDGMFVTLTLTLATDFAFPDQLQCQPTRLPFSITTY